MNSLRQQLWGLGFLALVSSSSVCAQVLQADDLSAAAKNSVVASNTSLAFANAPRLMLPMDDSLLLSADIGGSVTGLAAEKGAISTLDLTHSADDIWVRIRKGFGMTDLVSPAVDERTSYYASRPQALRTMLERGKKYLYHIVVELEKRGMPTELALLPIVESAFNPQAMSSAKAAGLWQFIPSTGRDFQLTQNWWVDERRDVVASTNAALQYLQAIYEMHGDWHLALASYNWGEGAVARAINNNTRAGKPVDFNSLNMPAETRQYVPKLQALKQIIAHPELYAVQLPSIPNRPYFIEVGRKNGMDIAVAAKLAEMSQTEFLALNPSYNRPVIPGSNDTRLVLPVENAQKFEQNLAHFDEPLVNWKTYSLTRSERIEQIAQRLHLSVTTLCTVNGVAPRARLAAGYTLLIPQTTNTSEQQVKSNTSSQARRYTRPVKQTRMTSSAHKNSRITARPQSQRLANRSADRRG